MLCGPSAISTTVRSAISRSSRSLAAVASKGRIRSAVPCTTSVGTSILGRSPRKSLNHVSTHTYDAYGDAPAATWKLARSAASPIRSGASTSAL